MSRCFLAGMTRIDLLQPLVNDRIQELFKARLLEGFKFFEGHSLAPGCTRSEAKLVILLVKIANPEEYLTVDEKLLINGGMRRALNRGKTEKKAACHLARASR